MTRLHASQLDAATRRRLGLDDEPKRTRKRATRRELPASECLPLRCHRCGHVLKVATDAAMRRHDVEHHDGAGHWQVVIGARK